MIRKAMLALIDIFVILPNGATLPGQQAAAAATIVLIYLVLQIFFTPYSEAHLDALETCQLTVTYTFVFFGLCACALPPPRPRAAHRATAPLRPATTTDSISMAMVRRLVPLGCVKSGVRHRSQVRLCDLSLWRIVR